LPKKRSKKLQKELGFSIEQRVTTAIATNQTESTMTTQQTMPCTQNEGWGFFGAMREDAQIAWPLAMTAISKATGESMDSVRLFLDSRHGRHFGDDVQNGLFRGLPLKEAINAATQQWMQWRIGRKTSKHYGIPSDLPYLSGFVIHCDICDEALAA